MGKKTHRKERNGKIQHNYILLIKLGSICQNKKNCFEDWVSEPQFKIEYFLQFTRPEKVIRITTDTIILQNYINMKSIY